jgi:hypothetical protein
MFSGDLTLAGQAATVVLVYRTAAVCSAWRVQRSPAPHDYWTFRATATRVDPFLIRQKDLLFRTTLKGSAICWPVLTLVHDARTQTLSGALAPPVS